MGQLTSSLLDGSAEVFLHILQVESIVLVYVLGEFSIYILVYHLFHHFVNRGHHTKKIDFFSVVLFDTKPPLQDSKFYADFKYVIYLKKC